ncbi:MAG: TIR domain-containing protein [Fibromonadales bacterium]|nr:TIR domain-containing protein [Fibromonadales bacterium]
MAKKYDIFISYRRKGGLHDARILDEKLRNDGYSVSFDIDTLGRGKFTDTLRTRLKDCKDFLIIFEPTYHERFFDEDGNVKSEEALNEDWCYLELKNALLLNKNIIPIIPRGYVFPKNLPKEIKEVAEMNAIEMTAQEFKPIYEHTIKAYLISKPRFTHRHRKSILAVLSLIIVSIIAYLGFLYLEKSKQADLEAKQAEEERIRAALEADSIKKAEEIRRVFIADSLNKLREDQTRGILDSVKAREEERRAAAAAAAAAAATRTELHWVDNGDETGRILLQKLSRAGFKAGGCTGNGLKVTASRPPARCLPNKRGGIDCSYSPQLTITTCDGAPRGNLTFAQLIGSDSKSEAAAKQKMLEELSAANFNQWVNRLQGMKQ